MITQDYIIEYILKICLIIIIIIIALIMRVYLLFKYKWVGKDTFYNYLIAENIRRYKKLPKTVEIFALNEDYDYPPFLHIFISKFNKKYDQKLQYISPILDILSAIIIFVTCNYLFDFNIAVVAMSLYLFTPLSLDNSIMFNSRSFGSLFFTVSIISIICFFITDNWLFITLTILFSCLILLTHRLTTQSWLIVMLVFSFAFQSVEPLIIIITSIFLSIILSKTFYVTVLKGHIQFLITFGKKMLDKNGRKEIPNKLPSPVILLNMPVLILIISFLPYMNDDIIKYFVICGISVTALSILWIFGEGIRHMANAVMPYAIVTAIWIIHSNNFKLFYLILIVSFAISVYKLYRFETMPSLGNIMQKEVIEAFNYIRVNKKEGDVLLCLPLDLTYNAAYFTDCTMLQSSGGFAKGLEVNQVLHSMIREGKIKELTEKYNAKWIINLTKNDYEMPGIEVYRMGYISIYKIND